MSRRKTRVHTDSSSTRRLTNSLYGQKLRRICATPRDKYTVCPALEERKCYQAKLEASYDGTLHDTLSGCVVSKVHPFRPTLSIQYFFGNASHVVSVLRQFHLPHLKMLKILPDNVISTNKSLTTDYLRTVTSCLKLARPSKLSVVLPKPNVACSKLTLLCHSDINNLTSLLIGGIGHYPQDDIKVKLTL